MPELELPCQQQQAATDWERRFRHYCQPRISCFYHSSIDDIRVMIVYICDVDVGPVLHHGRVIVCCHCFGAATPIFTSGLRVFTGFVSDGSCTSCLE